MHTKNWGPPKPNRQSGVTLIELMVGIAIGLLTIAVAIGALMVSRGISGTVTDASQIQQQASYAFRVIGQQLRQAASIRLNLAAQKPPGTPIEASDVVAFSPDITITPVSGKESPTTGEYALSVAYQNYTEPSFTAASDVSLFRDCLGSNPSTTVVMSQFVLENDELRCAGSNNVPQSILRNVAEFQVRYLIQTGGNSGIPSVQYVDATAVTDWTGVFGVEVCMVLFGDERISIPDDSTYNGCNTAAGPVNMSNTGTLAANRKNRLHMPFRNVYQLRSQGLAG
jgi:type IV pilus assembly protein PilW